MSRSLPRLLGLLGLLGVLAAALAVRNCNRERAPAWAAPSSALQGAAPSASEPGSAPISDASLASAITESVAGDPVLHSQHIQVSVVNGAVTLAGDVRSLAADWRVRRLIAEFKGASSLDDGLVVTAPSRPDAELAGEAGDAFKNDPATRTAKVQATASGAMLTLSGTADSYSQRDLLGEIAAHVPGVREVNLNVAVPRATVRSDREIAATITDRLHEDALLDGTRVASSVQGGDAVLSGVVGNLGQREAAVHDAQFAGAAKVDTLALLIDWRASEEARTAAARPIPTDEEIVDAVNRWLSTDAVLGPQTPTVRVERGIVTLSGHVADFRAARAARGDARRVSGVWQVEDRMTVLPAHRESDATIQKQVLRGIFDDVAASDSRDVQVMTSNARVTLRGAVASEEHRKVIEDDAEEVPGVVAVEDDLRVRGYGAQTLAVSPDSLRHRVIEAIFWDPRVEDRKFTVEVAPNGDVTLIGAVGTWGEARAAGDDAFRAGAAHVINQVRVVARM